MVGGRGGANTKYSGPHIESVLEAVCQETSAGAGVEDFRPLIKSQSFIS